MARQGSLYFGRCNVNDMHGAVAASSGDGVTTWAETDAVDSLLQPCSGQCGTVICTEQ